MQTTQNRADSTGLVSPARPCPWVTPQTLEGCVGSCLRVSCGPRWAEQRLRPVAAVLTAVPSCSAHGLHCAHGAQVSLAWLAV